MEQVVILGSGPAGWTAAIYAGRSLLSPVLITGNALGGQAATTSEIENYPGFPQGIGGMELMQLMQQQAERLGTRVSFDEVTAVDAAAGVEEISPALALDLASIGRCVYGHQSG